MEVFIGGGFFWMYLGAIAALRLRKLFIAIP